MSAHGRGEIQEVSLSTAIRRLEDFDPYSTTLEELREHHENGDLAKIHYHEDVGAWGVWIENSERDDRYFGARTERFSREDAVRPSQSATYRGTWIGSTNAESFESGAATVGYDFDRQTIDFTAHGKRNGQQKWNADVSNDGGFAGHIYNDKCSICGGFVNDGNGVIGTFRNDSEKFLGAFGAKK